ncbi:hypothetical protein, partial [Streptomyces fradiae]|uniref:hypothetical protein n=1 Tax=Streptomyces fradiae TaxID=1906 RepID=UPI0036A82939
FPCGLSSGRFPSVFPTLPDPFPVPFPVRISFPVAVGGPLPFGFRHFSGFSAPLIIEPLE